MSPWELVFFVQAGLSGHIGCVLKPRHAQNATCNAWSVGLEWGKVFGATVKSTILCLSCVTTVQFPEIYQIRLSVPNTETFISLFSFFGGTGGWGCFTRLDLQRSYHHIAWFRQEAMWWLTCWGEAYLKLLRKIDGTVPNTVIHNRRVTMTRSDRRRNMMSSSEI